MWQTQKIKGVTHKGHTHRGGGYYAQCGQGGRVGSAYCGRPHETMHRQADTGIDLNVGSHGHLI